MYQMLNKHLLKEGRKQQCGDCLEWGGWEEVKEGMGG